jgi:hypothetical protein
MKRKAGSGNPRKKERRTGHKKIQNDGGRKYQWTKDRTRR